MYPVFVYGTLKEGFPNFSINKGTRINGTFTTRHRYPLFLVGDRFSPWLILDKGNGHYVKGQVFQVGEPTLKEMDRLERINEPDGYRKAQIQVVSIDNREGFVVFTYGKSMDQLSGVNLRSGPLEEYKLKHAALYRSRSC